MLNFEIDTGASSELIVSKDCADWLGVLTEDGYKATLADGSVIDAVKGLAQIDWFGIKTYVEVTIFPGTSGFVSPRAARAGGRPHGLLGRNLLRKNTLTIDYPNGHVTLDTAAGQPS